MPKKGKKGKKGKGDKGGKKGAGKLPAGVPEGFASVGEYVKKEVANKFSQLCAASACTPPASFMKFLESCIAEDKLFSNATVAERDFTAPVVHALAETLATWSPLKAFCLWRTSCGDSGAGSMAELLKHNPSLLGLEMLDCGLTARGTRALGEALSSPGGNMTLRYLNLDLNNIGDEGAICLAEGMKGNRDLRVLSLQYCGIKSDGASALASLVIGTMALQELKLRGNAIGTMGAVALAATLTSNTTLKILDLTDNELTASAAIAIAPAAAASSSLEFLGLDANPIGEEGAEAVIEALGIRKTARDPPTIATEQGAAMADVSTASPIDADIEPPLSNPTAKKEPPPPLKITVTEKLPREMFTKVKAAIDALAPAKKGKKGKKKGKKKK